MRNRSNTIIRKAVFAGDRQLRRSSFRFAEDFRALRLRAGLSQADVARAIGVDPSAISRLEAGDQAVSAEIRARAAALLGARFRMNLYPDGPALIQDEAHARAIEAAFPSSARDLEQALASAAGPWPGDGILWVPGVT